MKILYVAGARMPTEKAHGIQIAKMCESFAKLGSQVELVLPYRNNKIKTDVFSYYGVKKSFKIKKLPAIDLIYLDRYLGNLAFWLNEISFGVSLFFYLLFKRTDAIYSRDVFVLPFIILKKKVFFEMHNLPNRFYLYKFWLRKIKGVISITNQLKNALVERGIDEKRIFRACDGVDFAQFNINLSKEDVRAKLDLPQNKKIVLYTGHLYGWKGALTLLESAKYLPEALFVFVGGTDGDISSFEFRVSSLGIKNVLIAGRKPHKEVPLWLSSADVLILPNSGKYEISRLWTSPLKMFEYMASSRPIIASDLPSLREVLNQQNAILVTPDNPEELAGGIKKILDNPELAQSLAEQGLSDVQQYSWDKRAQKIIDFVIQ